MNVDGEVNVKCYRLKKPDIIEDCDNYLITENTETHVKCKTCANAYKLIAKEDTENDVTYADAECKRVKVVGCHVMYDENSSLLGCNVCKDFRVISEDRFFCHPQANFPRLENCEQTNNSHTAPECKICKESHSIVLEGGKTRCVPNTIPNCKWPMNEGNNTNSASCKVCQTNHYRNDNHKTCVLGAIPTCEILADGRTNLCNKCLKSHAMITTFHTGSVKRNQCVNMVSEMECTTPILNSFTDGKFVMKCG